VPDAQGQINHVLFSGDHLGTARKSSQMMTRVAVVVFNVDRVRFADDVTLWRQHL
jgi:hypothetical protein